MGAAQWRGDRKLFSELPLPFTSAVSVPSPPSIEVGAARRNSRSCGHRRRPRPASGRRRGRRSEVSLVVAAFRMSVPPAAPSAVSSPTAAIQHDRVQGCADLSTDIIAAERTTALMYVGRFCSVVTFNDGRDAGNVDKPEGHR